MVLYCILFGLVFAGTYCRTANAQLETRVNALENQLQYGGKRYQSWPLNSKLHSSVILIRITRAIYGTLRGALN